MDSHDIKDAALAWLRFERQYPYVATEAGSFNADVVAADEDTLVEVEVKVSIADLRREMGKDKHDTHYPSAKDKKVTKSSHNWLPNKFYVAIPQTMLEKAENLFAEWEAKNPLVSKYGILVYEQEDGGQCLLKAHRKAQRIHEVSPSPTVMCTMAKRIASEMITLRQNLHRYTSSLRSDAIYKASQQANWYEIGERQRQLDKFVEWLDVEYVKMLGSEEATKQDLRDGLMLRLEELKK